MSIPFVSTLFTLGSVTAVLACPLLDEPLLALVPILLVLVYTGVAIAMSVGSRASLEWFGDHVYFLGYVSTITAFAGVVLKAWLVGDAFADPRSVLLMGGIALLTTVAGLVGMTFLRSYARALEPDVDYELPARVSGFVGGFTHGPRPVAPATTESGPAGIASRAVDGPAAARESVPVADGELRQVSLHATDAIARLGTEIDKLNDGIGELQRVVAHSNPEVETLLRNVTEVQSVLDGFVAYLGSQLETASAKSAGEKR